MIQKFKRGGVYCDPTNNHCYDTTFAKRTKAATMEEQADVFTTTARWIVLPTLVGVVVATTTCLSLVGIPWKILLGLLVGGWIFVASLVALMVTGYIRSIPPPPRCWKPPTKRSRDCGRRRFDLRGQPVAGDEDQCDADACTSCALLLWSFSERFLSRFNMSDALFYTFLS